jgi:hypothetical protein
MNITIDTNILIQAFQDVSLKHIDLVMVVRLFGHCITMDHAKELEGEYENKLSKNTLFQKWYKEFSPTRTQFCDCRVINRHLIQLNRFGFHDHIDQIALGIACNSDKYLLTEDSDFGKGDSQKAIEHLNVKSYITNQMQVVLHDATEAYINLTSK